MTIVLPPPHLSQEAKDDWNVLQTSTPSPSAFDPAQTELLPEPVRRWVLHTIAPGTPLRRAVVLSTHGMIKLDMWREFRAEQTLWPMEGYVWSAAIRAGLLTVRGFDRYHAGAGQMRWRLLDAFPVMSETGADVTRSAAGRLAGEFVLAPAAALDPRVRWKSLDDRHALASIPVGEEDHEVTLAIAPDGRLEHVTMSRWGAPDHGPYRQHLFEVTCEDETSFDGFTLPAGLRGSWDGDEFIRFIVDDALFR
ncbi:DUF6544 family protein [Nonomuraea sp. NPDC050022]|uniref:DUF6544 family protein n=1 Tax=unclassified Nonomuraea TaxID=2593643 RepID=UPI0033F67984